MSFSRTIVSRRSGFINAGSPSAPTASRAIYGTGDLGDKLGICKSGKFTDLGNKAILTNNTVVDTITYTGLGIEATYEVTWKKDAEKPAIGQLMRLPAPISAGYAEMVVVVDAVDVGHEEEGYRNLTLKTTHHAGFMDNDVVPGASGELVTSNWNGATLVDYSVQPSTADGLSNNQ